MSHRRKKETTKVMIGGHRFTIHDSVSEMLKKEINEGWVLVLGDELIQVLEEAVYTPGTPRRDGMRVITHWDKKRNEPRTGALIVPIKEFREWFGRCRYPEEMAQELIDPVVILQPKPLELDGELVSLPGMVVGGKFEGESRWDSLAQWLKEFDKHTGRHDYEALVEPRSSSTDSVPGYA